MEEAAAAASVWTVSAESTGCVSTSRSHQRVFDELDGDIPVTTSDLCAASRSRSSKRTRSTSLSWSTSWSWSSLRLHKISQIISASNHGVSDEPLSCRGVSWTECICVHDINSSSSPSPSPTLAEIRVNRLRNLPSCEFAFRLLRHAGGINAYLNAEPTEEELALMRNPASS